MRTLVLTWVRVETVEVAMDVTVVSNWRVKVELVVAFTVEVGVLAIHEHADETMPSATERSSASFDGLAGLAFLFAFFLLNWKS